MNALQPCKLEDLRVWDHILPGYVKQFVQALVWNLFPGGPTVDCPRFADIEESGHEHSFVDFQLCLCHSHTFL